MMRRLFFALTKIGCKEQMPYGVIIKDEIETGGNIYHGNLHGEGE